MLTLPYEDVRTSHNVLTMMVLRAYRNTHAHTHTEATVVGPEGFSLLAADMKSPAAPTRINMAFLSAFTSKAEMTGRKMNVLLVIQLNEILS